MITHNCFYSVFFKIYFDNLVFFNRYYEAKDVAARAIRDMKRGRDVSVLGFPVRLQVLGVKLLPHRLVMKIWCRQQKQPD